VAEPDPLAEKIPDAELLARVRESSDEPVSIIIELAVPDAQVEYATVDRHGETKAPVRVVPTSAKEDEQLEQTVLEAKEFLGGLLDDPPVYLRAARAFIATATGRELEEIARRPFTKRIEPNRSLPPRASASSG
jgi:hypothetical protein